MRLIVGLGNPGKNYESTRHNVGFMTVDNIARHYNTEFRLESKLKGMLASVMIKGEKTYLLKPMTYMNLSGESIRAVANFYKIPVEEIIIICDDLDSKTGRVRLRANGSSGGHNGLKSIESQLGTQEYKRIKIGIDRSNVIPVIDWVLQKFSNDEMALINQAIESARCRIYRLKQNEGSTLAHQMKAKNQQKLMKVTIKALEFYRDNK